MPVKGVFQVLCITSNDKKWLDLLYVTRGSPAVVLLEKQLLEERERKLKAPTLNAACLNHAPQQVPRQKDNYRKYLLNGPQTQKRISPATLPFADKISAIPSAFSPPAH